MAVVSIDNATAAKALRRDVYRFFAELAALERNMPPVPRKVFGDAEPPRTVMLAEEFPHGVFATFSGCEGTFLDDGLDWLRSRYDKFGLCAHAPETFSAPASVAGFRVGKVHCRRSFVCTSIDRVPPATVSACLLTAADQEAAGRHPRQAKGFDPGLPGVFRMFVLEGRGEIYAVKEAGEIVAYLSCMNEMDNIWDVEMIHVREEARGQGLGTQIAAMYAREKLSRHQVPYYSSAANEASERVATKAGFVCCREVYSAQLSPLAR